MTKIEQLKIDMDEAWNKAEAEAEAKPWVEVDAWVDTRDEARAKDDIDDWAEAKIEAEAKYIEAKKAYETFLNKESNK